MTVLGAVGVLLGLLGARFAFIEWTRTRVAVFGVTYLLHLAATFGYYTFSVNNPTDASMYFADNNYFYEEVGFGYGTLFVTYIVQALKRLVGGTFLDYFLLFQTISFFAICILLRILEEIYREIGIEQPLWSYALPLMPGLHFWTSAIGKDGFLLFGVCLTIWAAMNIRRRYLAMLAGLIVMLVIRPYIAPVGILALGGAIFFDRGTHFAFRILIVAISLVGLGFAIGSVEQTFSVDVTNADAVSEWLTIHEEVTQDVDTGGGSAVYGSYPFKLMSLLFRPMFIDAENIMGLAASVENFIFLMLFGYLVFRLRTTLMLARRLIFVRYTLMLAAGIALLLALVYYNIGLGLRQKTMFVPAIMVAFVTVMAIIRARRLVTEVEVAPVIDESLPMAQGPADPSVQPSA